MSGEASSRISQPFQQEHTILLRQGLNHTEQLADLAARNVAVIFIFGASSGASVRVTRRNYFAGNALRLTARTFGMQESPVARV
jgi:hypothetical protein